MLLAVDVGNTNTVLGIFKGQELVRSWRVKTDPRSTADELWLQYNSASNPAGIAHNDH
jgi:type III pantothenate kinase